MTRSSKLMNKCAFNYIYGKKQYHAVVCDVFFYQHLLAMQHFDWIKHAIDIFTFSVFTIAIIIICLELLSVV